MSSDSDSETTELDIDGNNFDRLRERMNTLGFQAGSAKGVEDGVQYGFDIGYSEGFKMGQLLGEARARIRCGAELRNSPEADEREKEVLSLVNKSCPVCSASVESTHDPPDKSFDNLLMLKNALHDEIDKKLQKLLPT